MSDYDDVVDLKLRKCRVDVLRTYDIAIIVEAKELNELKRRSLYKVKAWTGQNLLNLALDKKHWCFK